MANLTNSEFSRHLNTTFALQVESDTSIDVKLVEVKAFLSSQDMQDGMERFSAFFRGPNTPRLEQRMYSLTHDKMGAFDIFLVPVGRDERGILYEAVFNFKPVD